MNNNPKDTPNPRHVFNVAALPKKRNAQTYTIDATAVTDPATDYCPSLALAVGGGTMIADNYESTSEVQVLPAPEGQQGWEIIVWDSPFRDGGHIAARHETKTAAMMSAMAGAIRFGWSLDLTECKGNAN